MIFDIVLNHAGDVFGYKGLGGSADGGSEIRPIEWRDETGHARPDFPVIDDIPAAQRKPDGLIWPAGLQRNRFFRRTGKGGEGGGDFESLKEFVTDARDGPFFSVRCVSAPSSRDILVKSSASAWRSIRAITSACDRSNRARTFFKGVVL